MTWRTSSDPLILPTNETAWPRWAQPLALHMEIGTGTVILQRRNSAGEWATFATFDDAAADLERLIDVANGPAIRISATGNAKFWANWA